MFSIEQQIVFEKYLNKENIFMTGPGGCGKSHLLKSIYEDAKSKNKIIHITALTGCASVLLHPKAKTIHSWSGIGIGKLPLKVILNKILKDKRLNSNWKKTELLIIDEISMMSKNIFELLDIIGKKIRDNDEELFGGIQIILSGDFYQLPPIQIQEEQQQQQCQVQFCFESLLFQEHFNKSKNNIIQLKTIFRQNDLTFKKILNEIREGKIRKSTQKKLLEQINKQKPEYFNPTKLYPNRVQVDNINNSKLEELEGKIYNFEYIYHNNIKLLENMNEIMSMSELCEERKEIETKQIEELKQLIEKKQIIIQTKARKAIKSSKIKYSQEQIDYEYKLLENSIIVPKRLNLKIGAQVMYIINSMLEDNLLLCNGAQGIIIDFDSLTNCPIVRFNNGITKTIKYHTWISDNIPQLSISQIPLVLCWALTIHKSQGMSLDYAEIDVGSSIFECGQTYVALSRVKSLEGLYLTSFDINKIKINKKVKDFYNSF